jgi:N-methylhydantoinase A
MQKFIQPGQVAEIIYGFTVATNALLERKGAKTAIITTQGFEDIIELGRQNRPKIYDLQVEKPPPLVPRHLRYGVPERISAQGEILRPLRIEVAEEKLAGLKAKGVEAIAVCLLFSYANPSHEQQIAQLGQGKGFFISLSHEILPEFREYERCSTTVINAYVSLKVDRNLSLLEDKINTHPLRIMQSNGGCISTTTARREAVRTIFSGPAAGVLGGLELAKLAGYTQVITFDMGGTSTDVSLCDGQIKYTTEATVGGFPIKIPMIDIHSIGAGGGSLAYKDAGGALRVGPQSAGAEPGPACYGKGGKRLTVTDANLFLGRLDPDCFLGGEMRIYPDRIHPPLSDLAQELGLGTDQAASGIIKIINANMERAIRVISVERGFDPRDFSLVSFGGAGPMHACELASDLVIPRIIVPPNPGTLSALGLLLADVVKDYSQTLLLKSNDFDYEQLLTFFSSLEKKGLEEMLSEGFVTEAVIIERYLDMRYLGQSYEIMIPCRPDFLERFREVHEHLYGYAFPGKRIEVVNLRLKVVGKTKKPELRCQKEEPGEAASTAIIKEKKCFLAGDWEEVPVFLRDRLKPGHRFSGPAIVVEYSSTAVIPPDFTARVDGYLNLVLEKVN